jgi:hypothetical protein
VGGEGGVHDGDGGCEPHVIGGWVAGGGRGVLS